MFTVMKYHFSSQLCIHQWNNGYVINCISYLVINSIFEQLFRVDNCS